MESSIFNSLEQLEQGSTIDKVITISCVFKEGKTTVMPTPDGMGWYKGIPRLSESDKRDLTTWAEPTHKYILKEGSTFNLNDPAQEAIWNWVKFSPCLVESREVCQYTPGAEYYVQLRNKDAEDSVSKRELKYRAVDHVRNDSITNYALRAELLGVNMDGESPVIVKDYLLSMAEQAPAKILAIYEGNDISLRILLLSALRKDLIKIDMGGIYTYGRIVLGTTERSCISWMQDSGNKHLLRALEQEVNPEYFPNEKSDDDVIITKPKTVVRGSAKK